MTKARTKSARRRQRKISLPGGQAALVSKGQGARTDLPNDPPPILAARARRCPLDRESVLHESDMGRCILALSQGQERADLAQTWASVSTAHRNWRMWIIGQTGDPKIAAAPMMSDAMQTDPGLRVDLRTPEERDEAARRAWAEWEARLKALPAPGLIWTIRGALNGFMGDGVLWRDGEPTKSGVSAVHALKLLTAKLR